MAIPIREQIIARIAILVANINVAGGYSRNVSAVLRNIHRDSGLLVSGIASGYLWSTDPETRGNEDFQVEDRVMPLSIHIFDDVDDPLDAAAEGEIISGDLEKWLGTIETDAEIKGLIRQIMPGAIPIVFAFAAGSKLCGANIEFSVNFWTVTGDPYTTATA